MKNNDNILKIKWSILGIFLGGIIFGGVGVAAVTLSADKVQYTSSNEKFEVTNVKDALDEVYKIAEYKVPADKYFYEEGTEGDPTTIVRYAKIDNKYFICDAYGNIVDGSLAIDVTGKNLVPYTAIDSENLSAGRAGYASNNLILGGGSDNEASAVPLFTNVSNGTYSVVDLVNNYKKLTVDNFMFVTTKINLSVSGSGHYHGDTINAYSRTTTATGSNNAMPKLSYDSSTGKITLTNCSISASGSESDNIVSASTSGSTTIYGNIYLSQ